MASENVISRLNLIHQFLSQAQLKTLEEMAEEKELVTSFPSFHITSEEDRKKVEVWEWDSTRAKFSPKYQLEKPKLQFNRIGYLIQLAPGIRVITYYIDARRNSVVGLHISGRDGKLKRFVEVTTITNKFSVVALLNSKGILVVVYGSEEGTIRLIRLTKDGESKKEYHPDGVYDNIYILDAEKEIFVGDYEGKDDRDVDVFSLNNNENDTLRIEDNINLGQVLTNTRACIFFSGIGGFHLGRINKDFEFVKIKTLGIAECQLLSEDTYMEKVTGNIYRVEKGESVLLQQLPFDNSEPVVLSPDVFLLPRECNHNGTTSFFVYGRVPGGVYNQIQSHEGFDLFPGLPTFNDHIGERLVKEIHQVPKELVMVIARFI